jgi:hypothetical protein
MRRSDDAKPMRKIRVIIKGKKECKLLACPEHHPQRVLTEDDPEAAALKAEQERIKRQQRDLQRKKQQMLIRKATQKLQTLEEKQESKSLKESSSPKDASNP